MKVWLLWYGEYSGAFVLGVYSSLELAKLAEAVHPGSYIEDVDGYEVDQDEPAIRSGISRWSATMRLYDGHIQSMARISVGSGEPPSVKLAHSQAHLWMDCDAPDEATAVKILGDERAKYIAHPDLHNLRNP